MKRRGVKNVDKALGNVIVLSSVVRDEEGMPVSFRVMPFGPQTITQEGVEIEINFKREHAEAILAYWERRSSDLLIDTEHMGYLIAQQLKVEEDELSRYWLDKVGIGWWRPEVHEDGLYAVVTKWNDLGKTFIKDALFRWFSPVIKGISENNLRITSMSLVNSPGLDSLDEIAASAELEAKALAIINQHKHKNEGGSMKKLQVALLGMFGNTLVLSGEGELNEAEAIAKLEKMKRDHDSMSSIIESSRDVMALSAETDYATLGASLVTALEKGKQDALALSSAQEELASIKVAQDKEKLEGLISSGRAAGKIVSEAQEAALRKMDVAVLSEHIEAMPVIIDPSRVADKYKETDELALSADDDGSILAGMGVSAEDVKKYGGE